MSVTECAAWFTLSTPRSQSFNFLLNDKIKPNLRVLCKLCVKLSLRAPFRKGKNRFFIQVIMNCQRGIQKDTPSVFL
jgi:hypothetical protein